MLSTLAKAFCCNSLTFYLPLNTLLFTSLEMQPSSNPFRASAILLSLNVQTVLFKLFGTLRGEFPRHTVLGKLLHSWLQLGLVQREVIHAADPQDTHSREGRTDAIHERAARGTEVVGHGVVLACGFYEHSARLTESLQVVAAAQVL